MTELKDPFCMNPGLIAVYVDSEGGALHTIAAERMVIDSESKHESRLRLTSRVQIDHCRRISLRVRAGTDVGNARYSDRSANLPGYACRVRFRRFFSHPGVA